MDDPYQLQGHARAPAAVQPGLGDHSQSRQAACAAYIHANAAEGTEARQARQYAQLHSQQGTATPVLQGRPPMLQGQTARKQDVRVQCEATDCQALLQVHTS